MKLDEDKIKRIIELYSLYGQYSKVAKEVGSSPATVKKYVLEHQQIISPVSSIIISESIVIPEPIVWSAETDLALLCELTEEEKVYMKAKDWSKGV